MDSFNLWHWIVVAAVIAVLFGVGKIRGSGWRPKDLLDSQIGLPIAVFIMGFLTSALGAVIALCWMNGSDIDKALDAITVRSNLYLVSFLGSGLVWIALAIGIRRMPGPAGLAGWLIRIGAVTVLMGPLAVVIGVPLRGLFLGTAMPSADYLANPRTWFGNLDTPPYNVILVVRSIILVALAIGSNAWQTGASMNETSFFPPGPIRRTGPDETTRLLCGNVFFGGSAFRGQVISFFKDKWTATAPEFGLDVELLTKVCCAAERRAKSYSLAFAGVAVIGLFVAAIVPGIALPLTIFVAAFVWFRKRRQELMLARMFTQASFSKAQASSKFAHSRESGITLSLPASNQNLIVYRGFWPFVGAGFDLGGWSLVTFVDRPKVEGRPVKAFHIPELYAALDPSMTSLRLPGLRCQDIFFVRGADIKGDPDLLGDLANRPRQSISPELAELYAGEQNPRLRHYKCIQVIDWGGEVIVSYFLRCSLQGNTLLIEMKRYVLPPVADKYRHVDRMGTDRIAARVGQFLVSLVAGPIMAALSPFILLGLAQEALGKAFTTEDRLARLRRKAAQRDPAYDYGAATSLRMQFSQNRYLHYFQKTDGDFDNKLIERKILDEIERFLEERGIDTTDIRDRQTTILNSGILVQGGDVRAESLAVGQGAQATKIEGQSQKRHKESAT